MPYEIFDLLVIGAGPTGLACAIEAQKAGFRAVVVDKGCLCNSLFHYPAHMTFFTTPELLEIGDIPFPSPNAKPTRNEALQYYRRGGRALQARRASVPARGSGHGLRRRLLRAHRGPFRPAREPSRPASWPSPPATTTCPITWAFPARDLSKVHHYYVDPHPYFGMDVVVIGGKNSAAIAALELWRSGARVTLVHRGAEMHPHVKYWIKPDIENRIKNGEIKALFHSNVIEITPDTVVVQTPEGREILKNDFVFAMTGYHPDFDFLESLGVRFEGEDRLPVCDPETLESNVPGIYLAGVIVAGSRTNEIFIENGRFHGRQIARALASK